jgi:hypothetical protein
MFGEHPVTTRSEFAALTQGLHRPGALASEVDSMSDIAGKLMKKLGRAPAVEETAIRLALPSKLLARVDAMIARRPDPKPSRDKIIIGLMRETLKARRDARLAGGKKPQAKPQ